MIKKETMPNGLRLITENVPYVQSISIGIWVIAGSRDESPHNRGISHFIEHMMFKGTEKRTAAQIADEFDSIGGQVNAFTDKEFTCYYCRTLSEHLPTALEILSDMFLNSIFDPKEMELEKRVVLEEIKRQQDSPDDRIHDILVQKIWKNHLLGNTIIGETETVKNIKQSDIRSYLGEKYRADSIIISIAGNVNHEEVVESINKYLGSIDGKKTPIKMEAPDFSYQSENIYKDTEQVHFCIGSPGFSQLDDNRYPMLVIDCTVGGGMSSRLFQEVREKRGLAYAIGSYTLSYREGGYYSVFGGTSMSNIEEIKAIVNKEFNSILKENITEKEMQRSKNQLRGTMLLSLESMSSRMIRNAKSEIFHNKIITIDEVVDKLSAVTHDDIDRVAHTIWDNTELPLIAIGPFDKKGNV